MIVAAVNRLARTLMVQEGLLSRAWSSGAEVHSANFGVILQDDPEDSTHTLLRQVLDTEAQLDWSMLAARMLAGRRKKRPRVARVKVTTRSFGYSKDGPIPAAQRRLSRARDLASY